MHFWNSKDVENTCSDGSIHNGQECKRRWPLLILPIVGFFSLIWFLVRVIPKPSRATYPCQRVAFPLASGFVIWLLGVVGSVAAFRKAKLSAAKRRYAVAVILAAASIGAIWVAISSTAEKLVIAEAQKANEPTGVAQGINPGRVVWVHDPEATDWDGPGSGHWWQSEHTNQAVVDEMMSDAIRRLTGADSDKAAWDKLFRHLNKTKGKGDVGYKAGEKVTVKVNFVGFIWAHRSVNVETYNLESWRDYMNTSPQMITALLSQLTGPAGVGQADISICDTLCYLANEYYDVLHKEFPEVRFVDLGGKLGRTKAKVSSVPLYWSCNPEGVEQDYIPSCFAEAEYVVNLANLKAHTGAGVTLCAKNHYGSLVRGPVQNGYYDLHKNAFAKSTGIYRPLVDLMGHGHFGGKTMLYLIDGLYSGKHPIDSAPQKWESPPFNGDWTSSVLASQDPVAIDSVGFDFLWAEWEDYPRAVGVDDYLHEAAKADDPPSGTFYDPDHAGNVKRLASLGVHEHWNNTEDKQYSRNLGSGKGIELVAVSRGNKGIIAPGAKVELLSDGFKFTEGPAVDAEGNVYFTDQPNNRIHKWSVEGKLSTWHDSPGRANGLFFDKKGSLIACADLDNELWLIDVNGKATVLVKGYKGKKLNGPNDAWVDPKGGIYFTDPFYKRPYWNRGPMEQDGQHVYYVKPGQKEAIRVIEDLVQPNGIIGTADGKGLYVADIGAGKTYVYRVKDDGSLDEKKLFCSMGSDGMTIDNQGNIYLTGKGVTVFDSSGKKIEHIAIDEGWTANVCFGGKDRRTLFITAMDSLYAIKMRVAGVR
ncbi:MAG: SMP-30/gluconolactonase/LRE family protein [Sedimentisphaerales bacterium]|nr:SMP-30/gluconolactonase/LRE family protein [Sedimentisphaerales bacterium]